MGISIFIASRTTILSPGFTAWPTEASTFTTFPGTEAFTSMPPAAAAAGAAKRRHTSFASVNVTPEFDLNIAIDIKDEDLKIDVYHSSGAGGQSVNTSNSAVRITHLPTKTVVTCQTERSQLRNKEIAMELLKNKLYQQQLKEQEKLKKEVSGDVSNIDFGSQIRSYILEPYKLVKDHRTKYEDTDPEKVLDGDIMPFIKEELKLKQ